LFKQRRRKDKKYKRLKKINAIIMKTLLSILLMAAVLTTNAQSIHSFTVKSIDGKNINLASFKGKKILIVNTASKCGYTPQYEGLEKVYEQYKDKLVVIGFPCNQFGGQEAGTNEEIADFCKKNYGVSFPLADKIDVKGSNIAPIYQWLTTKSKNGILDASISWNFNKFLIDENGKMIAYFPSNVKPDSDAILTYLK
jgi:glutathione peroxidase